MKYGRTATRSITFMMFLANATRLGAAEKRSNSSDVNQTIQMVSMRKNGSPRSSPRLTSGTVSTVVVGASSAGFVKLELDGETVAAVDVLNCGSVSMQKTTIDNRMMLTDSSAIKRAPSELSGYSSSSHSLR